MKHTPILLLFVLFVFTVFAQPETNSADFNLGFEKISENAKLPDKWEQWGIGYDLKIDKTEKKSGSVSVSLEPAGEKKDNTFGAVAYKIPGNYAGKEIELRGFLKFADVAGGFGGLMLRIDGDDGTLQFDNMQTRDLKGTSDWSEYSIKLPLPENATAIYVGALMTGKGKLWVDGLQISIDGQDIKDARTRPAFVSKAAQDKEFDAGSKIDAAKLNKSKIEDLAALGRVWGFLKYHHPAAAGGELNWDYELFRVLPKILAAKNKGERNDVLLAWAENLGNFEAGPPPPISSAPSAPSTTAEKNASPSSVKLNPDLSWIEPKTLGNKLVQKLNLIKNAKRAEKNYYIGFFPGVGNPQFKNENSYKTMPYPDAGFRLLSLFRYWNVIQYFFPNRHLIEENWNDVLPEFVPQFMAATGELEYKKTALALIARIHDTHANIWGQDPTLAKYRGLNFAPVKVTFIEDKAVVTGYWDQALAEKAGLKIGDVIEEINGRKVSGIVKERLSLTPASNYPTQLRDIARYLLQTNESFLSIKYKRETAAGELRMETYPPDKMKFNRAELYGKEVPPFKLIGTDIAYLNPGWLKSGEIQKLIPEIAKTKGLVIDFRSYPSDFIVFSFGEFLMPKPTGFVKFSGGSATMPGLFTITEPLQVGKDNPDSYKGKVVILINETTQSSAEYHTMAFRTAPRATVIGSTTAGADGNVSQFFLPGGISTMISGIGVYYPDGKETQRIGIIPDIVVRPTIKGIREGKDELLDKAIEIINSK